MQKPTVSLAAFDAEDTELTSTIEIDVNSDAQAIELWQYLRQQAQKWLDRKVLESEARKGKLI